MRWVVSYFEWKASWWRVQAGCWSGLSEDIASGVEAYAVKQVNYFDRMAATSALLWLPVLWANGLSRTWGITYIRSNGESILQSLGKGGTLVP